MFAHILEFKKPGTTEVKIRRNLCKQYFCLWLDVPGITAGDLPAHYDRMRGLYNSFTEEERNKITMMVRNYILADEVEV